GESVEAPLILRHRDRLERALPVARNAQANLADLRRHRLVVGAVARVARPAASALMGPVAEMLGHLDRETGLQHMSHQAREQAALTGQRDAVLARASDQQLRPVLQRLRRPSRHELTSRHAGLALNPFLRHPCAPFLPPALSQQRSGHTSYTKFRTDPPPAGRAPNVLLLPPAPPP